MSGQTKAALLEENAQLLKQLATLEQELRMKIAVLGNERDALRLNVTRLEGDLEAARNAAIHFRAQRDTLTGYIEGVRLDRDETIMTRPDPYAEPVKSTRTDEFLESMMREPPPIGRTF